MLSKARRGPINHRVTIEPVRLRTHSDSLKVEVLRGIGFRFQCRCGVWGKTRRSVGAARDDWREHVREAAEAEGGAKV